MKLLLLVLLITACGTEGSSEDTKATPGPQGPTGKSCSVQENTEGAKIQCEDGTEAQINHGKDGNPGPAGADGKNGEDGKDGLNGKDGEVIEVKTPLIYEGYACGRTVVSIDEDYYVLVSGLVPLTNKWYKVGNSCSVRVIDGKLQTK